MRLTGQDIHHVSSITHDGKVLLFGTASDGTIYYSTKRSGFEDAALEQGADPFGFEPWNKLRLDASVEDKSVIEDEQKNLTEDGGKPILRSIYGASDEVTKTIGAPVQLVSGLGHLHLFRQSPGGKLLANRFVLDGITNELIPKLEVRFRRSRERLRPSSAMKKIGGALQDTDSVDFRDINGLSFYEPATELSFIGTVADGSFAVVLVPTSESDRYRWHFFAYDQGLAKLCIYTVRDSDVGLFDVTDALYGEPDPNDAQAKIFRTVPGIIKRVLDLKQMTLAGRPSATTYDIQSERLTDDGKIQLMREDTRLMLALPVLKDGESIVKVVALSFALVADGTLGQVDTSPDASDILRSKIRDLILPLTLLDDIKEIASANPPPEGTIKRIDRGDEDLLRIGSKDALPAALETGDDVKLRGTKSFDGPYEVVAVDGTNFEIQATFINNEPGFWEVVPEATTGLIFDNQIVGYEKTAAGKLKILCPSHDMQVGDQVQIAGTRRYDGTYPVEAVDAATQSFTLAAPFFTGEAVNLSKVKRRGLLMDGNDWLETPALPLDNAGVTNALGRTVQAWLRVDALGNLEQTLIADKGGLCPLRLSSGNKVTFDVSVSHNESFTLQDPAPIPTNEWVHYAATVEYDTSTAGKIYGRLYKNGELVSQKDVARRAPCYLKDKVLTVNGTDQYVTVAGGNTLFAGDFTVMCWTLLTGDPAQETAPLVCRTTDCLGFAFMVYQGVFRFWAGDGLAWNIVLGPAVPASGQWAHLAATRTGNHLTFYVNGVAAGSLVLNNGYKPPPATVPLSFGASITESPKLQYFPGKIADVRVYSSELNEAHVREEMAKRLTGREAGLAGYWPLDGGTADDRSPGKRHGVLVGNPTWTAPEIVVLKQQQLGPGYLSGAPFIFDGIDDFVSVPLPSQLNFSNGMTIEAWARFDAILHYARIVDFSSKPGPDYIILANYIEEPRLVLSIAGISGQEALNSDGILSLGEWAHFAAVISPAGIASIYKNGELVGTGPVLLPSNNVAWVQNFIGKSNFGGDSLFRGGIADVRFWSRARTQDELKANMSRRLSGKEPGLIACWPLDDGTANDITPAALHGTLAGNLERVPVSSASSFLIGDKYIGQIADVQIWNKARSGQEIKDTMQLRPGGREEDLAAYYPLGAIVYDEPPIAPDFSINEINAIVHGDPSASARQLKRATSSGMKVVQYSNDDLVAVTQRASYEESFEFRVITTNPAFDANNADGTGRKLFSFSYWGKSSRGSDEIRMFPVGSYEQRDFAPVGDGWYRASARFTVPDGINLIRAFEINKVVGVWANEPSAPPMEWTAIDIRKHRVRMISDAVTRDTFTDPLPLATLSAAAGSSPTDQLTLARRAEEKVDRITAEILGLQQRIDVAKNASLYQSELTMLSSQLASLKQQRSSAQSTLDGTKGRFRSYWCKIRVKHSNSFLQVRNNGGDGAAVDTVMSASADHQIWQIKANGPGDTNCRIIPKHRKDLVLHPDPNEKMVVWPPADLPKETWAILGGFGGWYRIQNGVGQYLGVGASGPPGTQAVTAKYYNVDDQLWKPEPTGELLPEAENEIKALELQIVGLDVKIKTVETRVDVLNQALLKKEDLAMLQTMQTAALSEYSGALSDFTAKSGTFLSALVVAGPIAMPVVATDERGRVTTGGVLDFARPVGLIEARETCEGNVQLGYFDADGRMRLTSYDAAADSRNTSFEQWLPDSLRACLDFSKATAKVTLAEPVTLPASGYSLEAWVHYPLAFKASGLTYAQNVLMSSADGADAPIVVRDGVRIGTLVKGWFFDSGAQLDEILGKGWHHITAVGRTTVTDFYADGIKVGSCDVSRKALTFDGAGDFIDVPAFESPTGMLTVSVWAKSATPSWNQSACLASKRNAFVMHPNAGSRSISFLINVGGSWKSVQFTPEDIQGWHLYTGVYNGIYLTLFIDGKLVSSAQISGAITADNGSMYIGVDDSGATKTTWFKGEIAEVAVWSRALGSVEITDLLRAPVPTDSIDLVGHWILDPIEESGAQKIMDLSGKKHHGVLVGNGVASAIVPSCTGEMTTIGNLPATGSPLGRAAEVRLWTVSLTNDEVAANATTLFTGNEPGLSHYWPMAEGTGAQVLDFAAEDQVHGQIANAEFVACTAAIGNPGSKVLEFYGAPGSSVKVNEWSLAGKSWTIEFWAKRSDKVTPNVDQDMISMGPLTPMKGLRIGWRASGKFFVHCHKNPIETGASYTDTDWHHWCTTYDHVSSTQKLYHNGSLLWSYAIPFPYSGVASQVTIGGDPRYWGQMAELRVWQKALTAAEAKAMMRRRAYGNEAGLLAAFPLDALSGSGLLNRKTGKSEGQVTGARLITVTHLPLCGADHLATAEYSSVTVSPDGAKQGIMRRSIVFPTGGDVAAVPERRIEELTVQWVGNAQFNPTLLGYIEGPPPVPGENLTGAFDYDGATSVTLRQSDDVEYRWDRTEGSESGMDMSLFLGAGWEVSGGVGVETKISEGEAGATGMYSFRKSNSKSSAVSAASSLLTSDSLTMTGSSENVASIPALGPRYIPKNVGYALVISGMADVFVTKLKRSGRMVSYEQRPVEGVPLDVNTITFMINPAYIMNGTLDGMVGSRAADSRFYQHVPAMRAQYGSLFPASYFRLKEAYALKQQIERQDKARESYFTNFSVRSSYGEDGGLAAETPLVDAPGTDDSQTSGEDAQQASDVKAKAAGQKQKLADDAKQREKEIKTKFDLLSGRLRVDAAFSEWQQRMERILSNAGKRNIVNTYVWDADGGLRTESQSFASSVEHSIGSGSSEGGGAGVDTDILVAGFKSKLSLHGVASENTEQSKSQTTSKALELQVDLSGLEDDGITDNQDRPIQPGEKVDRYRFMTFYLEGHTNHFNDFFSYVVDPEWLISNDEEARALRMARSSKPNACWRVMHRVTYVERPVLLGLGRDVHPGEPPPSAYISSDRSYFMSITAQLNDALALLKKLTTP